MVFERHRQGAVDLIRGQSPITGETVKPMSAVLDEAGAQGQPRVVIDLERVPLLDSSGLELLLDYRDRFHELGGTLKLAAPNALCRDILAVTGVGEKLEVFRDTVSAVGSFAQ